MNYFKTCTTLDEAKQIYRSFALKTHPDAGGTTEAFQDLQKQFEEFKPETEKFKGEFEQWVPADYMDIVNALLAMEGIEVEITGSWIWLSGETRKHITEIKALKNESFKVGWSPKKTKWYISPMGYRKKSKNILSMDEIRDLYGSRKIQREEKSYSRLK